MDNIATEEVDIIMAKPGTDGTFVIGRDARALKATDPALRCVDLIDNPMLQFLDLSVCATPVADRRAPRPVDTNHLQIRLRAPDRGRPGPRNRQEP